jgi:hypothetical protein
MKIKISEVWNAEGRSAELVVLDVDCLEDCKPAVWEWIERNRPDLQQANSIFAHGFHAIAVAE